MLDNQFFQILVYSSLIIFNLFFITGLILFLYFFSVLGAIKDKMDEFLEEAKQTSQKISEAAVSATEAGISMASFFAPFAIFKNIFGGKKKSGSSFISKFFN